MDTTSPERNPKGATQGGQVTAEPARTPDPTLSKTTNREPAPEAARAPRIDQHTPARNPGPPAKEAASDAERPGTGANGHPASAARLQEALKDRYLIRPALISLGATPIGQTEYRFRGAPTRVAFTEDSTRLSTQTDQPSVARSMVDVAQTREWRVLRVTGSDGFKRQVWLEASARGMKVHGHEPSPSDLQELRRQQASRQTSRTESGQAQQVANQPGAGGAGRRTVLAAIDMVLKANGVPDDRRKEVMAAATQKLAERIQQGRPPEVRLYDPTAPAQRSRVPVEAPPRQRDRPPLTR